MGTIDLNKAQLFVLLAVVLFFNTTKGIELQAFPISKSRSMIKISGDTHSLPL